MSTSLASKIATLAFIILAWPAHADLIIGSWNIQTLATNGVVFPTDHRRNENDFALLRLARDKLGADVLALEEVTSPFATSKVFPQNEYVICFGGQYEADAAGLGPHYPPDQLKSVKPTCYDQQSTLPDPAPDTPRKQYVAIVVRRGSGVTIESVSDVPALGLPIEEENHDSNTMEIRALRWGLEAVLSANGKKFRLLAVHLKSGCVLGALLENRWHDPAFVWAPDGRNDHPCMSLARQMAPLRAWIARARSGSEPFVIAGDFNRRIDVEEKETGSPDLWPIITGVATAESSDDIALNRVPEGNASISACWPEDDHTELVNAIDYLIFSPGFRPTDWQASYLKFHYSSLVDPVTGNNLTKADSKRMSDHCPFVVRLK
jgi:Endonuclease/Exonuclease/phosphatase family